MHVLKNQGVIEPFPTKGTESKFSQEERHPCVRELDSPLLLCSAMNEGLPLKFS